ncbi:hypothetical protein TIFTF001_045054 [Ficus carica]|uniref:Uncharacterized protein n=1 Tax=Ficus carica TaxID=3494 RepID=A0AA87ZF22_FICCA|nr:hypothetical protein TIFTF001_045054 [Ficus carica]
MGGTTGGGSELVWWKLNNIWISVRDEPQGRDECRVAAKGGPLSPLTMAEMREALSGENRERKRGTEEGVRVVR